jgi:hypothetical protein
MLIKRPILGSFLIAAVLTAGSRPRMILAVFLVSAVLPACTSVQTYPASWGILMADQSAACSSVEGVFRSTGERPDKYRPNLVLQLLGPHASWFGAERVELLREDADTLLIRTSADGQPLDEHKLLRSKGEFLCQEGMLAIPKSQFLNREGVVASERATAFLARAGDALVVREETSTIGMMFFFPVAGSSTTWSRYLPTN